MNEINLTYNNLKDSNIFPSVWIGLCCLILGFIAIFSLYRKDKMLFYCVGFTYVIIVFYIFFAHFCIFYVQDFPQRFPTFKKFFYFGSLDVFTLKIFGKISYNEITWAEIWQKLLHGSGTTFYSASLATCYKLIGYDPIFTRWINLIFRVLTLVLFYETLRNCTSKKFLINTGILLASFHPFFLLVSGTLLKEPASIFFNTLGLYYLCHFFKKEGWQKTKYWLFGTIAFFLAFKTHRSSLILGTVLFSIVLWPKNTKARIVLMCLALSCLVFAFLFFASYIKCKLDGKKMWYSSNYFDVVCWSMIEPKGRTACLYRIEKNKKFFSIIREKKNFYSVLVPFIANTTYNTADFLFRPFPWDGLFFVNDIKKDWIAIIDGAFYFILVSVSLLGLLVGCKLFTHKPYMFTLMMAVVISTTIFAVYCAPNYMTHARRRLELFVPYLLLGILSFENVLKVASKVKKQ